MLQFVSQFRIERFARMVLQDIPGFLSCPFAGSIFLHHPFLVRSPVEQFRQPQLAHVRAGMLARKKGSTGTDCADFIQRKGLGGDADALQHVTNHAVDLAIHHHLLVTEDA